MHLDNFKLKQSDQLFFIIKSQNNIGKNQIIKIISQAYNIINKIDQIFITALTKAIINNINRYILYIILKINT